MKKERNKKAYSVNRCLRGLAPRSLRLHSACCRFQSSLFPVVVILAAMAIRRTRLSTVGDHAFPPPLDSLPRDVTSAPMLAVFSKRLKTYLFSRLFSS